MDDDGDYYTDYSINRWWEEYFDDIEEFAGSERGQAQDARYLGMYSSIVMAGYLT